MKYNGTDVIATLQCIAANKAILILNGPNMPSTCVAITRAELNHIMAASPSRLVALEFSATAHIPGQIRMTINAAPGQVITATRAELQLLSTSTTWTTAPPVPVWQFTLDGSMEDRSREYTLLLVVPRTPDGLQHLHNRYPTLDCPAPSTTRGQQWCAVMRTAPNGEPFIHTSNSIRLY